MMNKLQKELGPKGLVVVGVTNEPESLVGKDVVKSKMRHPILITSGEDNERNYAIEGFPSGYVIDPDGVIVWEGHPGNLDEDWLKEQLAKLTVVPPVLPDEWKDVNAQFAKRKFGKAQAALAKALVKAPDNAELKAASEWIGKALQDKLAAAKTAVTDGEFGRAMKHYTEVTAQFDGVPGAEAGKAGAEELKKDKAAADELGAYGKLQEAIAQWRKGELDKGVRGFAAVAKKYPDTPSGKRAAELAEGRD
jgi:hypothetical protein